MTIALVFGILMAVVHYFSELITKRFEPFRKQAISFSAGIATTYIFLELIPNFSQRALDISRFLFLSILIGFSVLHVIEKFMHQHATKKKFRKEIAAEESSVSFVYHFVLGITAVMLTQLGLIKGLLFFVPILIYTAVSTLSIKRSKSNYINFILSLSTLLGVLFAMFVYQNPHPIILNSFLGFTIGALSYTVIRHSIPTGKQGEPIFFAIGVLLYAPIVIILGWL